MKCLRVIIDRQKDESRDDFITRKRLIGQHFSKQSVMDQALWEIFRHGSVASDSSVWQGINSAGTQLKARLLADRVEAVPEMQRIVAEIFFAILRYLHSLSTSLSTGVANSIWQSIRTDVVDKPVPSENKDLPDFVGVELFDHPDVLQAPFKTLQLDKNRGGSYHQVWIIDRIMEHGELWVGKYNRACHVPPGFYENKSRPAEEYSQQQDTTGPSTELKSKVPDTIIRRQLKRRLLATLSSSLEDTSGYEDSEDRMSDFDITSWAWYEEVLRRDLFTPEAEEARVRQLASTFNVDGPCVVATPFNTDWEVLPHPDLRSMSVCWVVDTVHERMMDEPGNQVSGEISQGSGQDGGKGKELEQLGGQERSGVRTSGIKSVDELHVYRVLDKVKGMWQIMDLPMQEFSFV